MAARTGQSRSWVDRLWTLNDVISISSDDESDVDDGDEGDTDDGSYEPEVGESHPDDTLPSISAIASSIATARQNHTEDTGKQWQGHTVG